MRRAPLRLLKTTQRDRAIAEFLNRRFQTRCPPRRQNLSLLNDGLDRSVLEVGRVAVFSRIGFTRTRSRARAASRCIQSTLARSSCAMLAPAIL